MLLSVTLTNFEIEGEDIEILLCCVRSLKSLVTSGISHIKSVTLTLVFFVGVLPLSIVSAFQHTWGNIFDFLLLV